MPLSYTTIYTVQTYDIYKRRRMTVAALVKQMQEAAMQKALREMEQLEVVREVSNFIRVEEMVGG